MPSEFTLDIMTMTTDELKEARSYAWHYFALHADQRMKLFNLFLILSGLILGAFPSAGLGLSAFALCFKSVELRVTE